MRPDPVTRAFFRQALRSFTYLSLTQFTQKLQKRAFETLTEKGTIRLEMLYARLEGRQKKRTFETILGRPFDTSEGSHSDGSDDGLGDDSSDDGDSSENSSENSSDNSSEHSSDSELRSHVEDEAAHLFLHEGELGYNIPRHFHPRSGVETMHLRSDLAQMRRHLAQMEWEDREHDVFRGYPDDTQTRLNQLIMNPHLREEPRREQTLQELYDDDWEQLISQRRQSS
jgi:hypothetical protein